MPQLDFVGFHYILYSLSFFYLFIYVAVTWGLFKPIFQVFFYKNAILMGFFLS